MQIDQLLNANEIPIMYQDPRSSGNCPIARKYFCIQCNKYYSARWLLRSHIKRIHNIARVPALIKNFKEKKCTIRGCGQKFKTNELFKDHIIQMHKRAINPCDICDKFYLSHAALCWHKKNAHSKTLTAFDKKLHVYSFAGQPLSMK